MENNCSQTHPERFKTYGLLQYMLAIFFNFLWTHILFCVSQAVANSTSATFLRVVGSELIQKYLGDGPKLVRELFRVADDLSPSIVFIDEIDAVGTKRWVLSPLKLYGLKSLPSAVTKHSSLQVWCPLRRGTWNSEDYVGTVEPVGWVWFERRCQGDPRNKQNWKPWPCLTSAW